MAQPVPPLQNKPSSNTLARPAGKQHRATDQSIYDAIFDAVLCQRLTPGTRLPEIALGELFGVSRSVVRKALTRLVTDEVLEQHPKQAACVPSPDIEETRELLEARRSVESEIVRLCAERFTPAQVSGLRAIVEAERQAHAEARYEDQSRHSVELHMYLAEQCPNRVLGRIQRALLLRTSVVICLYATAGLKSCFLDDDHLDLLHLIEEHRKADAAPFVHHHMDSLESLLNLNGQTPEVDLARILLR